MSDIFTQETPETTLPFREVELHNQLLQLEDGQVLHDLEASRQEGWNGATLAEIVLPTAESSDGVDKRLGLLDLGSDMPPEGRAVLYFPATRLEQKHLGMTKDRYVLVGLNYQPDDILAAVLPLRLGSHTTIGRNGENHQNHKLGLSSPGNEALSEDHLTVEVDDQGIISLTDHSEKGTKVILPA